MGGNDARQKESLAVAEELLARAKTFLDVNATFVDAASPSTPWWTCATADAAHKPPLLCGDGTTPAVFGTGWEYLIVRHLNPAGGATGTQALDGIHPLDPTNSDPLNGDAYFVRRTGSSALVDPLVVVAEGKSADNSGESVVRQVLRRTYTLSPGPLPPLTAPMVGALGSFNLVGNPNHIWCPPDDDKCKRDQLAQLLSITPQNCSNFVAPTGSGQMLSVWTKNNFNQLISGVASWDICHASYFKKNNDVFMSSYGDCFSGNTTTGCGCQTGDDPIASVCKSQNWSSGDPQKLEKCGIVDGDPNFPSDVFAWVFGASPADVKARADQVVANCDTLNADSKGLIWVTGNCKPGADQVGSRAKPVLLVVEGEVDFGANKNVWGVVVAHNSPSVKLGGGFTLHGAMVVDSDSTAFQASGTYNAIYDPCVFAGLYNNGEFVEYAPVDGSWNDQL